MVIAGSCFASRVAPVAAAYSKQYWNHRAEYAQIGEFLSQIPEDAPVAATTFYTTPLSQREVLYDVRYCSQEHLLSTQYVVLDTWSQWVSKSGAAFGIPWLYPHRCLEGEIGNLSKRSKLKIELVALGIIEGCRSSSRFSAFFPGFCRFSLKL